MISGDLTRRIRRIQIRTKRIVDDALAGEYLSRFKGQGIEFEEVREYVPGDEVRSIDWNVTARTGVPFVKRFREERQLTLMLMVDLSASGSFGSHERTKNEIAAEICALLAFSANRASDRVGLVLFTDRIERFIPPRAGQTHVLRIVRELLAAAPAGRGTDLRGALEYLLKVLRRRAVVFLLSDFLDEGYEKAMAIAARKHDFSAVRVVDPHERALPQVGLLVIEDAESGELRQIDTSNGRVREEWARRWDAYRGTLAAACARCDIDLLEVSTAKDHLGALVEFLARRSDRRRAVS